MPSHDKPPHSAGLSTPEFAVLGYLRTHPEVAKTYGIETCSPGCTGLPGNKELCAGRQRQDIHRLDAVPDC